MSERGKQAFVTLATNDTYSLGCLVLGNSLRRVNTSAQLVVMVTTGVSNAMRSQLSQVFNVIQEVNVLDSKDPVNLSLLGRPDLNVTFTKLHCWRLTQFDKAVFLDADTLVLQNVDELFDREELSAAPDAGWPDCFNSGVFVFKPSLDTYQSLLDFATSQGSFDGGDQGLLNMYYKNWATDDISKHLPFIYNVVSQAFYSYLPAFTQFKDRVKIVHFIGAVKPWHHTYDTKTRTVKPLPGTGHSQEFLQVWWNIFMQSVQPSLDPTLAEELTVTPFTQQPNKKNEDACEQNGHDKPALDSEYKTFPLPPHKETIHTMYPFKPPKVDEVFYEVEVTSETKTDLEEKFVELTVMPRTYSELESHYSEEPISNVNPEEPPLGTYSATWITEGWEKASKGPDPNPPDFTPSTKSEEVKSETTKTETKPETLNTGTNEGSSTEPAGTNTDESKVVTISEPTEKSVPVSPTEDRTNRSGSPAGLVGELASLAIQGQPGSTEVLSDAQRKLNWERGQIDYLGQDSFENIQKKIDKTMSTEEQASTAVTSSPFTPKTVSTVAVKPKQEVVPVPQAPAATGPTPKAPETKAKTSISVSLSSTKK